MSEHSPLTVLEAVLDEVDGLRRTDPRSFLPRWLLQQAREAIAPTNAGAPGAGSAALRDINDLQGRTIAHVFDVGVKRGDLVLLCADGSFIALEAETEDEDADIGVVHHYSNHPAKIEDYVAATWLASAGAISGAEAERIKQEEHKRKVKDAEDKLTRAKAHLKRAEEDLEKLTTNAESPA